MSILTAICDSIAGELNSHEWTTAVWQKPAAGMPPAFSLPVFTAERIYNPERKLEETETLRVDVIAGDIQQVAASRGTQQGDYRVDVAFRQKIDISDNANVDALGSFVEEVERYFFDQKQIQYTINDEIYGAGWMKSQIVYPYLPTQLRQDSQFVSLLRLTYRVIG